MKVPAFPDQSSITNGECKDQCMKNCSCVAYAYDAGIGCMLWSGDLIDVQKFSNRGVDLYIRLPSSELDKGRSIFRLGFFSFANSTNRYVGILYNQIPVQTVVWVANRNRALKDSSGVLTISDDGNLVVSNGKAEILWSTNVTNLVPNATTAQLLDSGNLVLNNGDNGNDCDFYGKCGAFGICDPKKQPICRCSKGFKPRNAEEWRRGNWSSGCFRTTPLQCQRDNNNGSGGAGQSDDGFLKLKTMKAPAFPDRSSIINGECKDQCMKNCSCVAYAYDAGIGCMFWSGDLIDVQKFPTRGVDLYIRLPSSELGKDTGFRVIVITTVTAGIVVITISTLFLWCRKAKYSNTYEKYLYVNKKRKQIKHQFSSENIGENPVGVKLQQLPLFNFEELATATNNFHPEKKLGQGGFGPVYKGTLDDGKEIAVKRLSKASGQGLEEFMNEVVVISKLQHRNLVRLLGCCVEAEEKILVYEFMPNKSLDAFLFDSVKRRLLDWRKRFNIIEGISRGLLYLYTDSRLRIIHRDLKTSNVLLDQDLNPKISDFGMARIFGGDENQANTKRVVGTYGYMSPEYAMQGQFSEKSDVFSYGVLLLEIISGRRNTSFYNNKDDLSLLGYGTLDDGKEIAVKRLSKASGQGLEEFMNEVVVISKLQHRNLVKLFGCCVEAEEKMLVYEFMPNKSLDSFLFDPVKQKLLDWRKRFNIIEGISRGLLYLHRDSRLKIIHRDLKASNVLLDQKLNPKISDFGIARIFGGDENQANTKRVVGTYGYMSPEYAMHGRFSEKSDVFSYGVLLLEIVGGRRNTSFYNKDDVSLLGYVRKLWNEGNIWNLVDKSESNLKNKKEIWRCIHVGLLCVQEYAKDRPTMSTIVSMLNSEISDLNTPKQPAFTQ
ncbi:hypothetical protein V6Z11_D01G033300, partial [Gossypium hirsutum]